MQRSALSLSILMLVGIVGCETVARSRTSGVHETFKRVEQASDAFHRQWSDGRAEVAYYDLETTHYGETRAGSVVLVYVTEPMDGRTWIKDDRGDVPARHRVNVIKLNINRKFRTGIYEYSAMTSVFAPVDLGEGLERFFPKKITFSAQEWCGQEYYRLMPRREGFDREVRSYFSELGSDNQFVATERETLYADALPIQLRELDGPFADGAEWSGQLVPSLWSTRKGHGFEVLDARITREEAVRGDRPVTRFRLEAGESVQLIDVETDGQRRILGWEILGVETANLVSSERLDYWNLNKVGDEKYFRRLLGQSENTLQVASMKSPSARGASANAPGQLFSHKPLEKALARLVIGGSVDYAAAKDDDDLRGYVEQLVVFNPENIDDPRELLAFWINAYNAFTISGVAALWPKIRSVSDVYPDFGFFKRRTHTVGGKKYSLDQIENKIIRKRFSEPRIHAALNCASASCPPLAPHAYDGARLDDQLDKQMRLFVRDDTRNQIAPGADVVRISEIFKWFKKDFDAHGGVRAYISRYLDPDEQQTLKNAKIRYLKYDWSLNKAR